MGHVLTQAQKALRETGGDRAGGVLGGVDPRARILGACAFALVTVLCDWLPVLLAALALASMLLILSRLPLRPTLRRMAAMDGFILFLLVLLPFTAPGDPAFAIWALTATWQGLEQAAQIAVTANAVVLALLVLVGTMEPVTLGHALSRLRTPERLVHLLMFTIRYIEVLRAEYLRLRQAMRARGFRPANSLHSYRSLGYLVGMMLVRAVERSERVLGAMKCRGFSGRIPLLETLRYGPRDAAFAGGLALMLAGLSATEIAHAAF
ncbi:cobalt ECF transporter T component CbiQ [Rhodovulum adriaticum]|uniref:Cobalt/nickel transport system permease protein n=1 Tax=Rhodovulum adriaticum TaxID=35804 RepID=A0A4R2NVW1_RHOAD|nr:cobalt ECF transporter T component CbiQ [Rhodovulum adriaticum]MBK1636443.1 cobalt ECF transporter T component CbiQ [Rhodovulum adriaticum]TCP25555.1 cobalt/nickel transport system permease protein [Rhodovulum adriaticum]